MFGGVVHVSLVQRGLGGFDVGAGVSKSGRPILKMTTSYLHAGRLRPG